MIDFKIKAYISDFADNNHKIKVYAQSLSKETGFPLDFCYYIVCIFHVMFIILSMLSAY